MLPRPFEIAIQVFIVVSMFAFALETLPNLSSETTAALSVFEAISITVFTIEYASRIALSKDKVRFVFSFFGFVDLIAILPFFLSMGIDLRSVRIVRMFRVLRLLKLARYNRAVERLRVAVSIAWEEMVLFGTAAMMLLYLSSVGIYYCENEAQPEAFASVPHSFWWSVCTLTTVGYGDVYPVTLAGRLFTFFVLVIGLGIVAVPAGLVASALSQARTIELEQHQAEAKQEAPSS